MRGVRPWRARWFRLLIAVSEGILAVLGGTLLGALLIWKLGLPPGAVLRFTGGCIWSLGAALAGRRCGLHGRQNGAFEGMLCGGLLELCRVTAGLALGEFPGHLWWHLPLLAAFGALGGVIGVNTKRRKAPF